MYMTEEEAKKKWCPYGAIEKIINLQTMSLIADKSNSGDMKNIAEFMRGNTQKCIAAGCMMWAWHRKEGGTYINKSRQGNVIHECKESIGSCGIVKHD